MNQEHIDTIGRGWIHDVKDQVENASLARAGLAVMRLVSFALKTQHDEQFGRDVDSCVKMFWARCERESQPPAAAHLDAMNRCFDRLVAMFDDDANNMPDQLLDDYLASRNWIDAQPIGWHPEGSRPQPNNVPLYSKEDIDRIVERIFLDNGTGTYKVFEDRACRHLQEMSQRYEQEIAWWQRYGINKNLDLVDAKANTAPQPPAPSVPSEREGWCDDCGDTIMVNEVCDSCGKPAADESAWLAAQPAPPQA